MAFKDEDWAVLGGRLATMSGLSVNTIRAWVGDGSVKGKRLRCETIIVHLPSLRKEIRKRMKESKGRPLSVRESFLTKSVKSP